jgi:site-specific recombinase XerD
MSLEDALAAFLTAKRAINRSPQTVVWYEGQITAFMQWLAAADLPEWFQSSTFDRYYDHLRSERKLQPASIRGAHRALYAFFAWMTKRKMVPFNPLAEVETPKVPRKLPRRTAPDEYRKLLDYIKPRSWIDLRDRLMIHTLFLSGIRVVAGAHAVPVDAR